MIARLLDHLWQSGLFAGLVALLAFLLRRQAAAVRYRLWLLASLKFLLPFALLAALGARLSAGVPHAAAPLMALQPVAAKLAAPAGGLPLPAQGLPVPGWLAVLWVAGGVAVAAPRLMAGLRLCRLSRAARDIGAAEGIAVRASASLLEPGLLGLWRPVVLLPAGLLPHLTGAERDAILAHELAHFRRRDNLTAGLHMLVEALFWFFPPVWLIGARLMAERERACDEGVLALGHDAGTYAGAILKACRFCIRSPLACVPGATGALADRIGRIVAARAAGKLDAARLALVTAALLAALALPLVSGLTPPAVRARVVAVAQKTEAVVVEAAAQVIAVPVAHLSARRLPPPRLALDVPLPVLPPQPEDPVPQITPAPPAPVATSPLAQAEAAPAPQPRVVLDPKGTGAPDEIVCRAPGTLPGSRLPGPVICQPNRVWAALRQRRLDFSDDGKALVSYAANGDCPFTGMAHLRDTPNGRFLRVMCS